MILIRLISAILFFILLFIISNTQAQTYIDYYNQGIAHYKGGNFDGFLSALKKADSLRPNHPVIMYNLAVAYSKVNDFANVAKTLERRFIFNASPEFMEDDTFSEFRETEYYKKVEEVFLRNTELKSSSELAFLIEEEGFHPEGIAYNIKSKNFLFTDVHNGLIVSYDFDGKNRKVISDIGAQGFWGAFGIKVDPKNSEIIWVTTAAVPEFKSYEESEEGESALLKIDVSTGKVLDAFKAATVSNHIFGELAITKDGTIYVSDSALPRIYKLDQQEKELSLFFEYEDLWNLQGLDITKDGKYLYFSDYILGVYRMELASKTITPILKQDNLVTRGTDGLHLSNGKLLLLQNGTNPRRITSIVINESGNYNIPDLTVLDQNRDLISEPTMGVFVEDEFYFIGNSPWGFYTQEYKVDSENWPVINIFKLKE